MAIGSLLRLAMPRSGLFLHLAGGGRITSSTMKRMNFLANSGSSPLSAESRSSRSIIRASRSGSAAGSPCSALSRPTACVQRKRSASVWTSTASRLSIVWRRSASSASARSASVIATPEWPQKAVPHPSRMRPASVPKASGRRMASVPNAYGNRMASVPASERPGRGAPGRGGGRRACRARASAGRRCRRAGRRGARPARSSGRSPGGCS